MDDLVSAAFRFLVCLVDVLADGDGNRRVVRGGGVLGDQLTYGQAVRRLESGDPARVDPLFA